MTGRTVALLLLVIAVASATPRHLSPDIDTKHSARPPNITSYTYGELAAVVVPPYWEAVIALLPSITSDVMPADVRPVRKALLTLRTALDVFSFAYPDTSKNFSGDPLPYVRDKLDDGYETIGHFRDLQEAAVNYTKKELITRRCEVLIWEADFEEKDAEHDIEGYMMNPLLNSLALNRKPKDLSSFFWRNTGFVPEEKDTGLHTIVKLTKALIEIAETAFDPLIKLHNMTSTDEQLEMHAYRKQIRGILSIGTMLPVWNNTNSSAKDVALLTTTYNGLGDIENLVNAYEFEVEHGDKESKDAAEAALSNAWETLRLWLEKDSNLVAVEENLIDNLIYY